MELVTAGRIVTLGEGMIEIAGAIGTAGRITFGGDVLNVTIALARMGFRPAFLTALGRDAWSDELVAVWERAGVDVTSVGRHPSRVPGLYGIRIDANGERSFTYWRDRSAARALLDLPESEALLASAAQADLLFLSGISLSLFDAEARERIAELAATVRRRGGRVAFDSNYRPAGWADHAGAAAAFEAFAGHVDVALPTLEDEALMRGGREEAEAVAARWLAAGASEVVVKLGAGGALVSSRGGSALVPTEPVVPVDTSGAGDAFDAGYLAARLHGRDPIDAARFGHRLARETILHHGAIPPADAVAHLSIGAVA